MCNPSLMQAASTAATAYGTYSSAQAASRAGAFQASQERYAAKVALDDAQQQAQTIRRAGDRAVGSADAAFAASGIKVGEGSAAEVDRTIYQQSEHDAYTALLTGSRRARALQVDAGAAEAGGRSMALAATGRAAGSVLAGGYQASRAWNTGGGITWDARGVNGTNDRSKVSLGSPGEWWLKYGTSGD